MTAYSDLGVIRRDVLWRKALPKVDVETRAKVERRYRIFQDAPFQIQILVADMYKPASNSKELPQDITPELISDLGRLIKETI